MNIVVCIKQVPESNKIKLNTEKHTFNRDKMAGMINSYDQFALEEAIRIKEKYQANITALSMGVLSTQEILKESMALGVDQAVLLNDRLFAGGDTLATAYVLEKGIKKLKNYDLIICGQQSTDGETAQVGPALGEKLGISQATYVKEILEISEDYIICKKSTDLGDMVVRLKMPALITVSKEINRPRLPSIRNMLKARAKIIKKWTLEDIEADRQYCGLQGSPTKVIETLCLEQSTVCDMINAPSVDEQVQQLVSKLFFNN